MVPLMYELIINGLFDWLNAGEKLAKSERVTNELKCVRIETLSAICLKVW